MALSSERIMEKSRNFQIVYAGHTNFQIKPTDHFTKLGIPHATATLSHHWGQASSRKQSECGRHSLSNIFNLQATLLQVFNLSPTSHAGKTNLFHMRGGRFHAGNMLCIPLPFKLLTRQSFVDNFVPFQHPCIFRQSL